MDPIREFQVTHRNLPHWQDPGSVYFLTWRIEKGRILSESDRTITLDSILFWHAKKWFVYAAVVMPDHVHVLARTLRVHKNDAGHDDTIDLAEIVGSIKKFSARRINEQQKRSGHLWQDERFDRIQRDGREFEATWKYIRENPVTAGFVNQPEEYPWLFEGGTAE